MSNSVWNFDDSPNMAVIANRKIIMSEEWIAYVSHDRGDGVWQFHTLYSDSVSEADAVLVSLQKMVSIDNSIVVLADLPLGWCAWRNSKNDAWKRTPILD